MRGQFLVFQDVLGYPSGTHGGVIEEFQPVVRALLEAKLLGPDAQGFFVARRRQDVAFNFAPVARVRGRVSGKTRADPAVAAPAIL